jgi:hypothetical protein
MNNLTPISEDIRLVNGILNNQEVGSNTLAILTLDQLIDQESFETLSEGTQRNVLRFLEIINTPAKRTIKTERIGECDKHAFNGAGCTLILNEQTKYRKNFFANTYYQRLL